MPIAYWMMRRQLGRVMTPTKVVIARVPGSVRLAYEITKFELKGIRLSPELHLMIGILASGVNSCAFCADLGRAIAVPERLHMEKFNALTE
jgi:hypothetical protein